jgi:catalase
MNIVQSIQGGIMRVSALVLAAALLISPAAYAEEDTATQTVDVFNKMFGPQNGYRAVHAKGVVAEGSFTPAKGASAISKAVIFQAKSTPVVFRFSNSTGLPTIPDTHPFATPNGFAVKFLVPGGGESDIVSHSYNGFPVGNGEEFLKLFQALAASGAPPFAPDSPILQYAGAHPAAGKFLTTPKPPPVSFATQNFYGVNAFKFTNAKGVVTLGRYRIVPVAGAKFLSADEAAKKSPNYLAEELAKRLKAGPVKFKLLLQLPKDGDALTDASQTWPDDRKLVELGTFTIAKLAPDSAKREKELAFTPTNLVDGIDPSDDPLIQARADAYAVSLSRRSQ